MRKNNNKGFTLLELLISIFILTTVIFLGYRVINKSTMDIKNQGNINQGQLTVNDMNEYLTKDLEKASSIVLKLEEDEITNDDLITEFKNYYGNKGFNYSYEVFSSKENEEIISNYEINITEKNEDNYKYTIVRTDGTTGVSITFVNNEIVTKEENKELELPFIIEGEGTYKVNLGYNGKNNKFEKHEFTIASRLNETLEPPEQLEPPKQDELPDIPDDMDKQDTKCIGFWMMDSTENTPQNGKGDLYAWIDGEGKYGNQGQNKEEFYIKADNDNGNSGWSNGYMKNQKYDSTDLIKVENKIKKANDLHKIKIYVSPYTTVKQIKVEMLKHATFKGIRDLQTNTLLTDENGSYTLQAEKKGKWYEVEFTTNNSGQANFMIDGILSIDKEVPSGFALIVYGDKADTSGDSSTGESTSDLRGDIIFDFYQHQNLKDKVCVNYKSNIEGLEYIKGTNQNGIDNESSPEMQIFYNDSKIRITGIDCSGLADVYKSDFRNIIGIKCSVSGKVKMNIFELKFESDKGDKEYDLNVKLEENNNTYTFNFLDYLPQNYSINDIKVSRLGWKFDFSEIQQNSDTAQIKIDLIYNE